MLDNRVSFMRRASAVMLVSTATLWAMLVDVRGGKSMAVTTLRSLTEKFPSRPAIYTFHTDDDSQFLLWKGAWQSAGFDAKRLTMEDAQRHPDYEPYSQALGDIIPYGHQQTKQRYMRYLAMSEVGGGFLGDINVLPLWPVSYRKVPVEQQFTLRCGSPQKPLSCLMSGSSKEWERIAIELLRSVKRQYYQVLNNKSKSIDTQSIPLWDDNRALQDISSFATGKPLIAKRISQTLSYLQATKMKENLSNFLQSQCYEIMDRIAVQLDDDVSNAKDWLLQWNRDCVHKLAHADLILPEQE